MRSILLSIEGAFLFGILLAPFTVSGAQQPLPSPIATPTPDPVKSGAQRFELNTELMSCTYLLRSQSSPLTSLGTGFLLGRKLSNDPTRARIVLVTAAHVLNAMPGDTILVMMRRRSASGWDQKPVPLQIRSEGHPLWVQHQRADVAAMYVVLPTDLLPPSAIPTELLADDKTLTEFEIHPGDELNVLGYPLGVGSAGAGVGFPVLRSGKIASYPLVPTSENPTFLLDFRVFQGNSGGPVYFVQSGRTYGGSMMVGTIQFIMGLVTQEINYTEQSTGIYENQSRTYPLSLAQIVPAIFIRETINMLPPP